MTTKEQDLLVMAAKAAGHRVVGDSLFGQGFIVYSKDPSAPFGNPMENDGDCLRLAAQLGIDIQWGEHFVYAVLPMSNGMKWQEPINGPHDLMPAVRRAVLNVAASCENPQESNP